jgi:DNA polymerase III subunit delta'
LSRPRKQAVLEEREEGHPRDTFDLVGHEAALKRVSHAIRNGKPPQAWLIAGPPGIGKATLAHRIARYLLKYGATGAGPADLAVAADDQMSRRISAQSHPCLLVVHRRTDDKGKMPTELKVDEVRRIAPFFGMSAGEGGWRVAIVDTADDMNENAANALLKNLEEPPPKSLLMLLSDAPGRLLPTIRSRCQRLDLRPLDEATLASELKKRLLDADQADREALARFAGGSLGLALKLAEEGGLDVARQADALLGERHPDVAALIAFGDRLYRIEDGLADFGGFLSRALAERIRIRAQAGEGTERWLELWERLNETYERAVEVNLDPRQTVLSSAFAVAQTKRRSGTV